LLAAPSWCVVMLLQSWYSCSIWYATVSWPLLWCALLVLISVACSCVIDSTWGLLLPSLPLCLHAHFLLSQHVLVSTLFQFVGVYILLWFHQCCWERPWWLSVQIVSVGL
jgi:hypothetical protein